MIKNYMPVGFHLGIGGNPTGIGDYMRILDAAGKPASLTSGDTYGPINELNNLIIASGAEHQGAWRSTKHDDFNALYPLEPETAVEVHWSQLAPDIPPEFNKALTWLIIGNEPNKDEADWLGRFAVAYANKLLLFGYKLAMFGWSTGTPEPDAWETPGMLAYLRLCEQQPDKLAVALHEYSLDVNNIQNGYPYLVGRFTFLHDVCDNYDIKRPTILISEWGWTYNDAPSDDQGMLDIKWAADLYAPYPNIILVTTWYLGGGPEYGNIANKVQPLIRPTTQLALTYNAPIIPIPPDETLEEHIWRVAQENRLVSFYTEAAFQKKLSAMELNIFENEGRTIYDGIEYGYQGGEDLDDGSQSVVAAKVPDWNNIFVVEDPANNPPVPGNPLEGLVLDPPFRLPYYVTSYFNDPRSYFNGLHEGIDVVILGQPPDSKEPVLNMYDGVVSKVRRNTGAYWNYVAVKHTRNGGIFYTWHAHLDDIFVVEGQTVASGHLLGELGGTGGPWNEHDHIMLQVPGLGLSGYAIPDVVDPYPYMTNATVATYDLKDYLGGDGRVYDVKFLTNDGQEHQERFQTQRKTSSTIFYQTKNQHWEEMWYDNDFIWRGTDTSHSSEKYYTLSQANYHGDRWIRRHVKVGDIYERNPIVKLFWKHNCQLISAGTHRTWIRVEGYHPSKTFFTGVKLNDVIELAWLASPGGVVLERYYYAKNFGLVSWEGGSGHSAVKIVYPFGTVPNNSREVISCL